MASDNMIIWQRIKFRVTKPLEDIVHHEMMKQRVSVMRSFNKYKGGK